MEFEMHIGILNRTWTVRGLNAIIDLVKWLDENAHENNYGSSEVEACPPPQPTMNGVQF
jgi:hypothetical protein